MNTSGLNFHIGLHSHLKRLPLVVFAFFINGLAVSLYLLAGFGPDSITVLSGGLANTFHITVGRANLAFFFAVILGAFFVDRKYLGIATLLSLVIVGPSIDLFMGLLSPFVGPESPMLFRMFLYGSGFFFLAFGISLYLASGLGISAADLIPIMASEKAHRQFRWFKVSFDVIVVTSGILLGGAFGWGTLLSAMFTGPAIQFLRRHIEGFLNRNMRNNPSEQQSMDHQITERNEKEMNTNGLFSPYRIKNLTLKNRIVLPPMCMYSASEDGIVNQWHTIHYGTRAIGGTGLLIIEATGVSPEGRITSGDLGIWDDNQVAGLSELVETIHRYGAKAGIQLNHAGRKCEANVKEIEAPSPIPFQEGSKVPREMTKEDIAETVKEFQNAALRAKKAGFDLIQIHAAHGYLLSEFLSPLTNHRTDAYGGSPENRVRILGEVIDAVRAVWPAEYPLDLRVSAEDYQEGGNLAEDLVTLINLVKAKGIDMVNVSSGGVVPVLPNAFPGYQVPHAEVIREGTSLPVAAGGLLSDAKETNSLVEDGKADLIYLGRELLRNPNWPLAAARELGLEMEWPRQYQRAKLG